MLRAGGAAAGGTVDAGAVVEVGTGSSSEASGDNGGNPEPVAFGSTVVVGAVVDGGAVVVVVVVVGVVVVGATVVVVVVVVAGAGAGGRRRWRFGRRGLHGQPSAGSETAATEANTTIAARRRSVETSGASPRRGVTGGFAGSVAGRSVVMAISRVSAREQCK